jgi:hypothetical protein
MAPKLILIMGKEEAVLFQATPKYTPPGLPALLKRIRIFEFCRKKSVATFFGNTVTYVGGGGGLAFQPYTVATSLVNKYSTPHIQHFSLY